MGNPYNPLESQDRPAGSPGTPARLAPEIAEQVEAELQPGETLVWTGQPDPWLYSRSGLALSCFGVFFFSFALLWTIMAGGFAFLGFQAVGPPGIIGGCLAFVGLPFILVGLGLLTAPLWLRRNARRTVYAITNQRAIVWEAGTFATTVHSFGPQQLANMTRRERPNGSGDLVFQETAWRDSEGDRQVTTRGFLALRRVRQVEDLIRTTLLNPPAA